MSENVKVYYGDAGPAAFAGKLLSAARAVGEDVSVVMFSPEGYFELPAEVADEAGVDYGYDEDREFLVEEPATVDQDEVQDDQGADESDDQAPGDPEVQDDPEGAGDDVSKEPFDASGFKGKGLDAALTERGLSTEGKADEKRARLAEFEDNKE